MNGKYFHTVDKLRGKKTIMKRNCVVLTLLDTLGDVDLKCVMPTLKLSRSINTRCTDVIGSPWNGATHNCEVVLLCLVGEPCIASSKTEAARLFKDVALKQRSPVVCELHSVATHAKIRSAFNQCCPTQRT